MIAVTIGTTSWRQTGTNAVNEVEFTDAFRYDASGHELMIWDAGLGNMRAMTDPEVAALPAQRLTAARTSLAAMLADALQANPPVAALRAVVLVALDELNAHALKLNAILDAVDGAATLAALKTAIAAIPDYPQRTPAQLKTAMQTKIAGGDVDT